MNAFISRIFLFASGLALARATPAHARECVTAHADAQVQRMHGALLSARQRLLACAQPECPTPVANDCVQWLGQVEDGLVFVVSDDAGNDLVDVHITADGRAIAERADGRALPIDRGSCRLRFEAEGYQPSTLSVSVRQSEKNRSVRVNMVGAVPSSGALRWSASF